MKPVIAILAAAVCLPTAERADDADAGLLRLRDREQGNYYSCTL